MKSKYTQTLSFREANIFLKILTLWIWLVSVLTRFFWSKPKTRFTLAATGLFLFIESKAWMLKAYNSSLYMGLRSAEYYFQTLSNARQLSDDSSKTSRLQLLRFQKTSYQYLGRQHFSSSPSPVPSLCKAHLLCDFKTHTPAINSVWFPPALSPHKATLWLAWGWDGLFVLGQRSLVRQLGVNIWPYDANNTHQEKPSLVVSKYHDCNRISTAQV